jgi:predicted DNA-binding transcriptional regulator YafY
LPQGIIFGAWTKSERTVWPVILGHAETTRLLVAWCEMRQNFRHH